MDQKGVIFVFCSSCKILDFASYVSPRIIAEMLGAIHSDLICHVGAM